jgi:hypothetical protein
MDERLVNRCYRIATERIVTQRFWLARVGTKGRNSPAISALDGIDHDRTEWG